jgi:DNA polymerase
VFGEGREQPGDYEDQQGRPFVGPAGKLLAKAFDEAGVDRADVYLTNAVKHFKFEPRGKRRIHQKPNTAEILACRPWLEAEVAIVKPELIVAMGVTAAQTLLQKKVAITPLRGKFQAHPWGSLFVTVHPSAILRARDEDREREYSHFVQDLKAVAGWLRHRSAA